MKRIISLFLILAMLAGSTTEVFAFELINEDSFGDSFTSGESSESFTADTAVLLPKSSEEIIGTSFTRVESYDSGIYLNWRTVSAVNGYVLYRKEAETGWEKLYEGQNTAYIDTDISGGTEYYYAVSTYVVEESEKMYSAKDESSGITAYPMETTILDIETSGGSVTVTWKSVEGATSYTLYRRESEAIGNNWYQVAEGITECFYEDGGVKGGISYTYAVRSTSITTSGNTLNSAWATTDLMIVPDIIAQAPEEVNISVYNSGNVVTWNRVNSAAGYRLFRRNADSDEWILIYEGSKNGFTDKETVGGQDYIYGVESVVTVDTVTVTSNKTESDTVTAYPKPTEIISLEVSGQSVIILWSVVPGASTYRLYRRVANESNSKWQMIANNITDSSYTDTSVIGATEYTYAVTAVATTTTGNEIVSAWATTDLTVCVELSAPIAYDITVKSYQSGIILKWDVLGRVNGYKIYRKEKQTDTWKLITDQNGLNYLDIDTEAGKEYIYGIEPYIIVNGVKKIGKLVSSEAVIAYPQKTVLFTDSSAESYAGLSWTEVNGADFYTLYNRVVGTEAWLEVASNIKGVNYQDASILPGITYEYAIKASAYDPYGNIISGPFVTAQTHVVLKSITNIYNVSESCFGAKGNDRESDSKAIQMALNKAKSANSNTPVTILVPPGTYYIDSTLFIYSNTILQLKPGARIVRKDLSKVMLQSIHQDEYGKFCQGAGCTHGGYSQVENITVFGGAWDGNISSTLDSPTALFSFAHISGLSLHDLTLTKCCGSHMVNIDAVNGLKVNRVTFSDFLKYTGSDTSYFGNDNMDKDTFDYYGREALHIDYITPDSDISVSPLTPLGSKNIVITECTFDNCVSGVGTHNAYEGLFSSNIIIQNNSFTNIQCNCINLANFTEVDVLSNIVNGCEKFILLYGAQGDINNNLLEKISKIGIHSIGTQKLNMLENTLNIDEDADNYGKAMGICLMDSDGSALVSNNKITVAEGDIGISVSNCNADICENTIDSPYIGINAVNCSEKEVKIIDNELSCGTYAVMGNKCINSLSIINNVINDIGVKTGDFVGIRLLRDGADLIEKNIIKDIIGSGIEVSESSAPSVINNTITNCISGSRKSCFGIRIYSSAGGVVDKNLMTVTEGAGVEILESSDISVSKNKISQCTSYGFSAKNVTGLFVENNQSVNNTKFDIVVTGTSTGSVINNFVGRTGIYCVNGIETKNNGRDVNYCQVKNIPAQSYKGKAVTPKLEVLNGSECLTENVDYTVTYRNNDKIGMGVARLTGIGSYIGSLDVNFAIQLGTPTVSKLRTSKDAISVEWNAVPGADYYTLYRQAAGGDWSTVATKIVNTSFTDNSVKKNITYTYALKAYVVCGNETYNSAWGSTDLTAKLDMIATETTKVNVIAYDSGIVITWPTVPDATCYRIYRREYGAADWSLLTESKKTGYTDKDTEGGQEYIYGIETVVVNDNGSILTSKKTESNRITAYPMKTSITKLATAGTSILINWERVAGARFYTLYRKTSDVDGSWTQVKERIDECSYMDSGVTPGKKYLYAVRTTSITGNGSPINSAWAFAEDTITITLTVPDTPVIKSISADTNGVTVEWNAVSGAQYYVLYRKAENQDWTTIKTDITASSYIDKTVKKGTTYTYAIKSYVIRDNTAFYSKWGDTVQKVTAVGVTPDIPLITDLSADERGVTIKWNVSRNSEFFTVYRQAVGENWSIVAANIKSTSYIDTSVVAGTTYTYALKAHSLDNSIVLTSGWGGTPLMVKAVSMRSLEKPLIYSLFSTNSGIIVNWKEIGRAEYYTVYRMEEGKKWTTVATHVTGDSYKDTTVTSGTKYTYAMKSHAVSEGLIISSDWSGTSLTVTADKITPETPVIMELSTTEKGIMVKWRASRNADYYTVYRQKTGENWTVVATRVCDTFYLNTTVKKNSKYTYAVKAHAEYGESISTSGWGGTLLYANY